MRKLLILLLLPIVAFATMGASAMAMDTSTAAAPPALVQTLNEPALTLTAADGAQTRPVIPDYEQLTPEQRDKAYASSIYLPTNRWTSMSYHSRLDWWNPVQAANAATSRGTAGMFMNAGNHMWKIAADFSRMAMEFKPLNSSFGHQIDKIASVIGKAVTGQPVLFALIITFLIVVLMWRAMRRPGTRPFGKLAQSAIVFGLIMMMGTQAAAGTSGKPTENYKPRPGSPVWIAGAATGTIDNMAGAAVAGVMDGMLPIILQNEDPAADKGWSCAAVIQGALNAAATNASPTSGAKAVNVSMNSMWISTAFNTYAVVQFGDSNKYAKEVACRELERTTSMPAWSRARILSQSLYGDMYTVNSANPSLKTPFLSMDVPMLQTTGDNEANDAAMVAWAACAPKAVKTGGFTVRGNWGVDMKITEAACRDAFGAKTAADMKNAGKGIFNIGDIDAVREKTSDPEIINFMTTLHGRDSGASLGSVTSSFVFLLGAVVAAGVFGLMSLAVFGSKLFMLLLVAALFLILIVSLFKNESMGDSMRQPAFRFLGVTIFAFGATVLLALVATVSSIIASLATMLGPAGALGPMMWVSFSPLLAIIAVHFLFTKLFKIPSPVTAKGALAWGTAGGAVGAAVGTGMVNRLQNRGAAAGKALGRKALASNKYTGWMVKNGQGANNARKGAGDAGSRAAEDTALGTDLQSQHISEGLSAGSARSADSAGVRGDGVGEGSGAAAGAAAGIAGAVGVGARAGAAGKSNTVSDEHAAAAAVAAQQALKHLSADTRKEITREAKKQRREENPSFVRRGITDLKGKLEARNDARAAALADAVNGGQYEEASMLSESARGKVSLINRPAMDSFLMAPGEEKTVAAIPAAAWSDLSPQGKAEAAKLAAANTRAARESERDERLRQAKLRREARAAAKAELPPLSDRAKNAVKATANSVSSRTKQGANAARDAATAATRTANTAWSEAKTKSLEFRADPAGTTVGAVSATLNAARKASYSTAAGVEKTREVASRAAGLARTDRGRKVLRAAALGAGAGVAAMGSPVVGGVMVAVATKKSIDHLGARRAARKQVRETQLNEIIAARATARKMPAPRTSIVSDAAPVQAPLGY